MRNSRRRFLKGLSLAVLAPRLGSKDLLAETKKIPLPIAFSTLGCPSWEWKKILDFASQYGFARLNCIDNHLSGRISIDLLADQYETFQQSHHRRLRALKGARCNI